jgi:F0F1-type ATP synthase membrane subunit c/vacuolar-type H+-ATPase subunit K
MLSLVVAIAEVTAVFALVCTLVCALVLTSRD